MKMRNQSRIFAFKIIFAVLFENDQNVGEDIFHTDVKLDSKAEEFAFELVNNFLSNKQDLEKKVAGLVEGYELNRIFKVDLALIYLALTEIEYIKTPKPVVVSEIVEIAKKFSTEKSSKFINGVLAKV